MKKILLLFSLCALAAPSVMSAVPFLKGAAAAPQRRVREPITLVAENFARFTDGTQNAPSDPIKLNGYHIPDSLTAQPGWTGGGLCSAGGCVKIQDYEYQGNTAKGYITTPQFMLQGTAVITFRARAASFAETSQLWVSCCDSENGPGDDQMDIDLTTAWKDYTLEINNPSLEFPSSIQFSAWQGSFMLDNVRLVYTRSRIAAPYALHAQNLSPTSFKARWEAVPDAPAYRLNVFETAKINNPEQGEIFENFDAINTADGTNLPEGWKIVVNAGGTRKFGTGAAASSQPVSIIFDAVGDTIETPTTPYPIDGFEFWVKPSSTRDDEQFMSLIRTEIYHENTGKWENISHLPASWLKASGMKYSFVPDALGDDCTRVRMTMVQKGRVNFYIDDVRVHYRQRGNTTKFIDNLDIAGTETEHVVEDINPENTYIYYVQAVDEEIVSEPSYMIWVDGITGLKVQANEATDVTATGFTASWQPLGHATDYRVDLYSEFAPKTDLERVTILKEDFNSIDEGTVEKPGTDPNSPFDFSSRNWAATAWGATQPAWAKGMAGTLGTSAWVGNAGLVYTPALNLSCYDGNGIDIKATFVTTVDAFDNYQGQKENEGVFAMILRGPDDVNPIASGYLETPAVGSTSGTMTINNVPADADLSKVIIAFMNKSGLTFFVDECEISMNIPAGKTLMVPVRAVSTTDTQMQFTDLNPLSNHAFSVTASASHAFEAYVSEPSDLCRAATYDAAIDEITADPATPAAIYDLQGRRVSRPTHGIYIVNGRKLKF